MRFDQVQDRSGRELYAFVHDIAVPEFVKTAAHDDEESVRWMDDGAFADRVKRAFPISTPARTWVSHVFYMNKRAQMERRFGKPYVEKIGKAILEAAELFGIADKLAEYDREKNVKQAAPSGPVPVSTVEFEGQSLEFFHVKTAEELKDAMTAFASSINRFPFEWRTKIAQDFVTCADRHSVDEIPTLIAKYAGLYFADVVSLPGILEHRRTKIADEKLSAEYANLVKQAETATSNDEAFEIVKKAAVIERQSGVDFNQKVSSEIGDIVDRTFSLSVEKVASILDCVEMGGEVFDMAGLKRVPAEIYKEAFGLDIDPSNDNALREILPTMPRSDVSLFRELSGASPLG